MLSRNNRRKQEEIKEKSGGENMEADIRWLDDPKVFRVGQLPAHSDHPIYQDTEEAAWYSLWTETGSSPIR